MPFLEHPPGFGRDSLRLLDIALTRSWLERLAMGASLSHADPAVCRDLWRAVERLDAHQAGRRIKAIASEKDMAEHRYKVGQRVIFHSPRVASGPSLFTVMRLMPSEGQDLTYRIKSIEAGIERMAKERELSSLQEEPT